MSQPYLLLLSKAGDPIAKFENKYVGKADRPEIIFYDGLLYIWRGESQRDGIWVNTYREDVPLCLGDLALAYHRARKSLRDEQIQHASIQATNEYHKMRGEYHDAIGLVRSLSVRIADLITGYREE